MDNLQRSTFEEAVPSAPPLSSSTYHSHINNSAPPSPTTSEERREARWLTLEIMLRGLLDEDE